MNKTFFAVRMRILLSALLVVLLSACGSNPSLPVQLVHLRAAAPGTTSANPSTTPSPFSPFNWQLATPVRVPDYLDRDALLVPQGKAGLQAVPGVRWAEPLRESVPRLLRQDLATLLGENKVWTAPLPPGLVVQRQLRVELLALEANQERNAVVLRARWSVADVLGGAPPRVNSAVLSVPSASDADSLAAAHRAALWQLAQRIAAP